MSEDEKLLDPIGNIQRFLRSLRRLCDFRELHLFFKRFVPFLGRGLSLFGEGAVLIYHLGFDDVEKKLRIGTSSFVYHLRQLLEIGDRFHWIPVVDLITTDIQQDEFVEHFENILRRLVNHHEHQLAFESQFLQ